jgi:hypothetical protein
MDEDEEKRQNILCLILEDVRSWTSGTQPDVTFFGMWKNSKGLIG